MNTPLKRGLVLVLALMVSQCTTPAYANAQKLLTATANTGNNAPQERRNLYTTVQHHTIVDVFLCPSFFGAVSHARAIVPLWWGGGRNKPFIRRILPAVVVTVFDPPYRPIFRAIIKTSLPVEKVQQ